MAHSTGGMAVLVLLSALLATANAALSIKLGRVGFVGDTIGVETFAVEGLATVQIGGTIPPSYYLDCLTTADTNSDLRWTRETGQLSFEIEDVTEGVGLRLQLSEVEHNHLDVYVCTDISTGDTVQVNVTDGNPAVCPVMDEVTTAESLSAQLDVYVSGYPVPVGSQIHWYRPSGEEIFDSDENVRFTNSRKRLILSDIRLSNAGTYDVEVMQEVTPTFALRARTGVDLVVEVRPVVISQPINSTVVFEGQSFSLSCTVSGNPSPSITWEKMDGSPLNSQHTISTQTSTDIFLSNVTSTLTVPSSIYSDMGLYRCSADNRISLNSVVSDISEVTVRPVLTLSATNTAIGQPIEFSDVISLPEGSQFTVDCVGSGDLTWSSSTGLQISSNMTDDLYQSLDFTSGRLILTFKSFTISQIAVYTCESPLRDIGNVPITESVLITNTDPAVFITPTTLFALDGDTVSIEAGVFASSVDHTVEWFLGELKLNTETSPHFSQTVENSLYTLTITDIDSQRLGEYTVVVTLDSTASSASDSVNVSYSSPPTVSVATSQLTINESNGVRVQCQGVGVGRVRVEWFFEGDDLPSGVRQEGADLYIESAARAHAGEYECRVSNIAGTVSATVNITVNYPPFSVIRYNLISSTSNQLLSAEFDDESVAPNFICSSDGSPNPRVSWRKAGSGEFPVGVETQAGGSELVWGRRLEYTDSGRYECVSENVLGTSVATLELTVQFLPIINSIYSSASIESEGSSPRRYLVPTGFTGTVVTCGAFGWPPPSVEWLYKDGPLPDGVQSSITRLSSSGSRSARLVFLTGFNLTYEGEYLCVVKESDTLTSRVKAESIQLIATDTTATPTPPSCSVSSTQVNFQLRVLDTDCASWSDSLKETIRSAFQDEILRITQMQCDCTIDQATVQIPNLPECSTEVQNGVVFSGTIETSSVGDTQTVFCSLSSWQQTNPSININNQLFQVDSGCSLRLNSFSDPECVAVTTSLPLDQMTLIIVIAVPAGVVLLVFLCLLILIACCLKYKKSDKTESWSPSGNYSSGSGQNGGSNQSNEESQYETLHRPHGPSTSSLRSPNYPSNPHHLRLEPVGSNQSRDLLLGGEYYDGELRYGIQTETGVDTGGMSTGNVESVGIADMKHFVYSPESSSGASSRVISPPQRPSSKSVVSATNPIPDYEQLDENYRMDHHYRAAREVDSIHARKFSEGSNSPSTLANTGPYSVLVRDDVFPSSGHSKVGSVVTQGTLDTPSAESPELSSSVSKPSQVSNAISEEDPRRASDCSEGLPPYSSRPPSEQILSTSMLDNSAYGRVEPTPISTEGDQQWYMNNSDFSIDSKSSRQDIQVRGANGRTEIPPYAMIHNSAIPYVPTSIREQASSSSSSPQPSQTPPMFRMESRKQSNPQPYSEPIQSSLASMASQSSFSPKFETVVV